MDQNLTSPLNTGHCWKVFFYFFFFPLGGSISYERYDLLTVLLYAVLLAKLAPTSPFEFKHYFSKEISVL